MPKGRLASMRSLSRFSLLSLATVFVLAACGGAAGPTPSVTPDPDATPTPAPQRLAEAALKYRLLDQFGALSFCDPDMYPVGIDDIAGRAAEHFPEIEADRPTFMAIIARLGLVEGLAHQPDGMLAVYAEWKMLNAMVLDPIGNDRFRFDMTTTAPGTADGVRTGGIVDSLGVITIEQQAASGPPVCPICLARGTLIDTPDGARPVQDLRIGDPVWTVDQDGTRIAATVLRAGWTAAPATHRVVHVTLDDGRELWISPGHPLLDGRTAGDVKVGDTLGGSRVRSAELEPYGGEMTFDILPSGPTGGYWAGGILVGSSLSTSGG